MKLQEAKQTIVFVIENDEIKEVNLYDKMLQSIDETTSPRGVEPRLFIEEMTFELDPDDFDGNIPEDEFSFEVGTAKAAKEDYELLPSGIYRLTYFVISSWGQLGNNYRSGAGSFDRSFLTIEGAEEKLFEYLKVDFSNDWDNSCGVYYNREDAIEVLSEELEIDSEVCEHILRKKEIVASIRKERKLQAQERYEREK